MKESIVKGKAMKFALLSIDLYKVLLANNEFVISKQFIKSSTSIGANVNESLAGQSKKDFIAKMSIASKEARETQYWLEVLQHANFIKYEFQELNSLSLELIKILTSIVKTSQNKQNLELKTKT